MVNGYYIAHNAPQFLGYRGFGYDTGAKGKKKKKGKGKKKKWGRSDRKLQDCKQNRNEYFPDPLKGGSASCQLAGYHQQIINSVMHVCLPWSKEVWIKLMKLRASKPLINGKSLTVEILSINLSTAKLIITNAVQGIRELREIAVRRFFIFVYLWSFIYTK